MVIEFVYSTFNFLKSAVFFMFIIGIIYILVLYLNQDKMIYATAVNGMQYTEENPDPYKNPGQVGLNYKEIKVLTKDGYYLYGWLVYVSENVKQPTIIYFHENAGSK